MLEYSIVHLVDLCNEQRIHTSVERHMPPIFYDTKHQFHFNYNYSSRNLISCNNNINQCFQALFISSTIFLQSTFPIHCCYQVPPFFSSICIHQYSFLHLASASVSHNSRTFVNNPLNCNVLANFTNSHCRRFDMHTLYWIAPYVGLPSILHM